MQTRSSDEKAVCLSVCLSNALIVTKREKDLSRLFIPYEGSFSLVFWEEEWLVGAIPSGPTRNFRQPVHVGAKSPILNRYSLVAPQPLHLAKKSSITTNRKSTTCFPMSLRWSSYVAPKPPKGGSKRKTADFRLKSHFDWRKSATKFVYVKTVSGEVLNHSLA